MDNLKESEIISNLVDELSRARDIISDEALDNDFVAEIDELISNSEGKSELPVDELEELTNAVSKARDMVQDSEKDFDLVSDMDADMDRANDLISLIELESETDSRINPARLSSFER